MDKNKSITYIKNVPTSSDRTLRIEVVGPVSEAEKHMLDGIAYLTAGAMKKEDQDIINFVSEKLSSVCAEVLTRIKNKKEDK